jgi:hypothetical protein
VTVAADQTSCTAAADGDTVTVVDSGGVGTTIEWTVEAADASGNWIAMVCGVAVGNPGGGP